MVLFMMDEEFGDVTIERGTFEHTGVTHIQDPKTKESELREREYAATLKPIDLGFSCEVFPKTWL